MKITADTNVLIRAAVRDDVHQAREATKVMQKSDLVAVPIPFSANLCGSFDEVIKGRYLLSPIRFAAS